MPELPKSWNLKTRKRNDGKLDVVGKDDAGKEYRVRTTDTSEITERDVRELKAADRENYPNRQTAVREFVKNLCPPDKKEKSVLEHMVGFDEGDWIAAAEPIVHAGFGRKGCTVGSSYAYRRGWDHAFREET